MNCSSLRMRGSLALFSLFVYVASAVPFTSDGETRMTAALQLVERDVQSICGFWVFPATPDASLAWSFYCNGGLNCAIDDYVTPHIVFCSTEAFVPYTTFYNYGDWPAGGCGFQEACCPSTLPIVRTHTYDHGASLYFTCDQATANITDGSQNVFTQLGEFSISLASYSTVAAALTTAAAPASTTAIMSATSTPLLTSVVVTSMTQSTSTQTASPSPTPVSHSDSLGFKIGLGVGLGLGIPLVLAAGFCIGMWMMRTTRPKESPPPVVNLTQVPSELGSPRVWTELNAKGMQVELSSSEVRSELGPGHRLSELDSTR